MKNCFIFLFVFSILIFWGGITAAQEEACDYTWTEYSCGGGCGGAILATDCSEYCSAWETECTAWETECAQWETECAQWSTICIEWDLDGECIATTELCVADRDICVADRDICVAERDVCRACGSSCGAPYPDGTCNPWQVCQEGSGPLIRPDCQCAGTCLETPDSPKYYDNPTYSDEPSRNLGNSNVKLPVKLDWDNVAGWGQADGPQSYNIQINNTTQDNFSMTLDRSEFIPSSCLLISNSTHSWQVQACCNSNGTDCGGQSAGWSLTTNAAPELVSPLDSDWNGPGKKEETVEAINPPVTLDWCDVDGAKSWLFRTYLVDSGLETCHPWLFSIGGSCDPWVIEKIKRPPPWPVQPDPLSEFFDQNGFFTKNSEYRWEISACFNDNGTNCTDFSQKWGFQANSTLLPAFSLLSPQNDPSGNRAVGLPITLDWQDRPGINSFIYRIEPGGINRVALTSQVALNYPQLSLDTVYAWAVKPCWDYQGQRCEENFTGEWYFKTTGAQPSLAYPDANSQDILIPVKFDWEDVSGAGSYKYEVSSNPGFTDIVGQGTIPSSDVSVDYPNLRMLTDYWWRARTCADKEGNICGNWSEIRSFKTFKLAPPANPLPQNNGNLSTSYRYLSWDLVPGAKSYQYTVSYDSDNPPLEEQNEGCMALRGTEIIPPETVSSPPVSINLECLGNYSWSIRSCLDQNCQETSDWSNYLSFVFVQPPPPSEKGLVPCGRMSDFPGTPWNEREPCQFKHLFLILKNIIDFFLWRLIPIILVLLALATGAVFYFSMGAAETIINIRGLWKSVGIGLGIIFFAWIIINIFLSLVGFQVQIFGRWWDLKF